MQSASKCAKGPKPLRSRPPRAVNGQHGFKSKSPTRECGFRYEAEGREDAGVHEVLPGEAEPSLQPEVEPAGVYSQDVQIQDAALGQRQQAFWRLRAHLL